MAEEMNGSAKRPAWVLLPPGLATFEEMPP